MDQYVCTGPYTAIILARCFKRYNRKSLAVLKIHKMWLPKILYSVKISLKSGTSTIPAVEGSPPYQQSTIHGKDMLPGSRVPGDGAERRTWYQDR